MERVFPCLEELFLLQHTGNVVMRHLVHSRLESISIVDVGDEDVDFEGLSYHSLPRLRELVVHLRDTVLANEAVRNIALGFPGLLTLELTDINDDAMVCSWLDASSYYNI